MEDEWSIYDSEVMESGYDFFKFKEVLKHSKEYLLKLDAEKRLEIIREVLKNPNFDDTDVCYLVAIEIQDPSYKPPSVVPKKPPLKFRFVMKGRQPAELVWEEEKVAKKSETTGRKRTQASSDCEFDDEEESDEAIKKRANMKKGNNFVQKKKVNELVQKRKVGSSEIIPELPVEFKKRIQNLGGTEATLVMQKELTTTDVSTTHTRLSLPRGKLKDQQFLSKEKAFKQNSNGVAEMGTRLIAEDGKVHEIDVRQWSMNKGIYVLVKGWNDVVLAHGLCATWTVQLWSFRVEGSLWFALVKI